MVKQPLLLLAALLLVFACNSKPPDAKQTPAAPNTTSENGITYVITASGKKIPQAEKGITIVSENGWTQQEMDFQLSYCEQMFSGQEGIDPIKFCTCFLSKIQYYYQPIYVREAYEDQIKWNATCIEQAQL
ncbi:MAG TPA: hypothetical protein PK239_01265 [Chitinophagales bacterium]|nr:hypothetical protein [Chitinophagales bacterium]HRK25894.1 hypothetical protein [Chitinophagales bacterium]